MDNTLPQQLKEAELAVAEAEKQFGPDTLELADRLLKYAALLRQTERRKLDAVNVEARARAIRAKHFQAEEAQEKITATIMIKPQENTGSPGMYLGLGGLVVAMCTLVLNQGLFPVLAILAIALVIGDLVTTRGAGWWRALLALVFVGTAFACTQSLPPDMLTDATPLERFTYASENPTLVSAVKGLDKPTHALGYQLALPHHYAPLDPQQREWGKMMAWASEPRSDGTNTQFYLMQIKPEDAKKLARTAPMRAASEIAMPIITGELQLQAVEQDPIRMEEMNGFEFAKCEFRGSTDDRRRSGFAYVAKQPGSLIALVAIDSSSNPDESLQSLEGTVSTFSR